MYSLTFSPELELLLCCSHTCPAPAVIDQMHRMMAADLDWAYLVETARRHGVVPLLYKNLKEHTPDFIPAPERKTLRDYYLRNAGHNLRLLNELKRLAKGFADAGLMMIPFKGPLLAEMAYGGTELRRASFDLDIIVRRSEISRATDLLQTMGYMPAMPARGRSLQDHIKFRYHLAFSGPHAIHLELHWHVVPRYMATFAMDDLFQCVLPASTPQLSCLTFAPDDLLLLLCIHAAKDFWTSLSLVCDLNELLLRHPEIDLERLIQKSRRQGNLRMVLTGLCLVNTLLSTPLPPAVEKAIAADRKTRRIAARLALSLLSEPERRGKAGFILFKYRLFIQLHERMRDKLHILFVKLFQLGAE
jgi:hypothetical protein